jgi:RNA polymerase sigma-70 factor (ECF subfamily)
MNEKELIQRIQSGDEEAFKWLVDSYQLMVRNTCYGVVQDFEEAEDVAQQVFIKVYESIDKFRGDAKLSTWLYRIALNKSLNRKKQNRFRGLLSKLSDSFDGGSPDNQARSCSLSEHPDKQMESNESMTQIQEAINQLPGKQKQAFVLHKYEELSHKEIAEIMKTSVSSVESLIFRARKQLRTALLSLYNQHKQQSNL